MDEQLKKWFKLVRVYGKLFIYFVQTGTFTEVGIHSWNQAAKECSLSNDKNGAINRIAWRIFGKKIKEKWDQCRLEENNPSLSGIVLQVANTCNLRCLYCSANYGRYGNIERSMTKDIARRAVDFLFNQRRNDELAINFFGGEPTLNWNVVLDAAYYSRSRAKSENVNIALHLVTNGLELTKEVLDDISELQMTLTISLDGPRDIHDRFRPRANGIGSYHQISKRLRQLVNHGIANRVTIRGTYLRPTAYFFPHVKAIIEEGFSKNISYEPVFLPRSHPLALRWADLPKIKRAYSNLAEYYVSEIRKGRPFCMWDFDNDIISLCIDNYRRSHCGAGRRLAAVTPDGELYACHMSTGFHQALLGNIDDGLDSALQKQWMPDWKNPTSHCFNCWLRAHCGGGCTTHSLMYNGDYARPYRLECAIIEWRVRLSMWIISECPEIRHSVLNWIKKEHLIEEGHVTFPIWAILDYNRGKLTSK